MWSSLDHVVTRTAKRHEQVGEFLRKALAGKIDTAAEERLTGYVSKEPSDALTEWAKQGSKKHLANRDYVELVSELYHRYCTWAWEVQHVCIWTIEQEDALATMKKDVNGLRQTTGGTLSAIRKTHHDSQYHCRERVYVPDDPISIEEVQCVERVIKKLIRWRIYDHLSSILNDEELDGLDYDGDGFPILSGRAQKQKRPGRPHNTQHNRLVVRLGEILSCTTLKRAEMARCIKKVLKTYEFDVKSSEAIQQVLFKANIPPKRNKVTACIRSKND